MKHVYLTKHEILALLKTVGVLPLTLNEEGFYLRLLIIKGKSSVKYKSMQRFAVFYINWVIMLHGLRVNKAFTLFI